MAEHEALPSFSVIIPAYQAAGWVGDAVASALEQTMSPREVVVCDDGSTDDIDSALAPYRDRIVLVRQENRGLPAAKNAATARATGEFVAVLDADDVYLPGRLEAMARLAAERPELDIIATDLFIERDGEVIRRFTEGNPFPPETEQRAAILDRSFIWSGSAVRRPRLLEVGGFDETVDCAEDWDCWRRLIFTGSRVGLVAEPLARYRLHPAAMTADRARDLRGRVQVLERAAGEPSLTAAERAVVARSLARERPRALIAEARRSVRGGADDARSRSLAVVTARGVPLTVRLRALAAAIAPRAARRRMSER
jgi:glycosyltransferase involved in cell wall biosynthesis